MKTETENTLAFPIIHMNGTGVKTLRREYDAASETLAPFLDAWRDITFHSRDYYVVPGSWEQALAARMELNLALEKLQYYLDAHRAHLHD
jgi:hypothetical protein